MSAWWSCPGSAKWAPDCLAGAALEQTSQLTRRGKLPMPKAIFSTWNGFECTENTKSKVLSAAFPFFQQKQDHEGEGARLCRSWKERGFSRFTNQLQWKASCSRPLRLQKVSVWRCNFILMEKIKKVFPLVLATQQGKTGISRSLCLWGSGPYPSHILRKWQAFQKFSWQGPALPVLNG